MLTEQKSLSLTAVGRDAFRQEYLPNINPQLLRKDIESYLGEYRLEIPIYNYELLYSFGKDENRHLRDIYEGESMLAKGMKAIRRRINEEKSTRREDAELAGIINLEKQLKATNLGDTIIWASPPGPKNEGYGNYGFIYIGVVDKDDVHEGKRITMKAIRVEKPTISQFNQALSALTGFDFRFNQAEEFLANPVIVNYLQNDLYQTLFNIFDFTADNSRLEKFRKVIAALNPYIQEFINLVKAGVSKQKLLEVFFAIENFALELKERGQIDISHWQMPAFEKIVANYNYQPPMVGGSCGGTASKSNDIFNSFSSLNELLNSNDYKNDPNLCRCGNPNEPHFHCPGKNEKCNHPIIVGQGVTKCPACGLEATCK